MTKNRKIKSQKILSMTLTNELLLLVHPDVKEAYQVFCDSCTKSMHRRPWYDSEEKVIELIKVEDAFYFFDNFVYINNLKMGDVILAKLVDKEMGEIRHRAWGDLFKYVIAFNPVGPNMIRRFIAELPNDVHIDGVEGRVTIATILKFMGVKRYQFDYQDKVCANNRLVGAKDMPSLDELIMEVIRAS